MKAKANWIGVLLVAAGLLAATGLLATLVSARGGDERNKTYFTGKECGQVRGGTDIRWADGSVLTTGIQGHYKDEMSDPRVSGDGYVEINLVSGDRAGSGPMWGTHVLVNEKSIWSGHWTGELDKGAHTIYSVLVGSGAYEGLVAYETLTRPNSVSCFDVSGYIVKANPGG